MRGLFGTKLALVALPIVLSLSGAVQLLHFVATAHRVCLEHGDFVHADSAETLAAHPAQSVFASAAPDGLHHQHDHCDLVSLRREEPEITSVNAATVAANGTVARRRRSSDSAKAGAILRWAPKASPPALG